MGRTVSAAWPEIRRAAERGQPLAALAKLHGIKYDTVLKRSQRERWATDKKITAAVQDALLERVEPEVLPLPSQKEANPLGIAEVGQQAQTEAAKLALASLRSLRRKGSPVLTSIKEVREALDIAMKAAGLDKPEGGNVQILIASDPVKVTEPSKPTS